MRHARGNALVLALVVQASVAACHREPPAPEPRTEATALAEYRRMAPTIRVLEGGVASGLSRLVELDPFGPCAEDACIERRASDAGRLQTEIAAFRRDVVPRLVRGQPVLGLEITAHFGDSAVTIAQVQPTSPGHDPETTPVVRGIDPDAAAGRMGSPATRRRLGWGRYETAFADGGRRGGDRVLHPGIELIWETGGGVGSNARARVRVEVRVVLLTDGFRRPAEWPGA